MRKKLLNIRPEASSPSRLSGFKKSFPALRAGIGQRKEEEQAPLPGCLSRFGLFFCEKRKARRKSAVADSPQAVGAGAGFSRPESQSESLCQDQRQRRAPLSKKGGRKRERGSALITVLISSAIGLIVIHGVTKSLVQSKLNQLILDRKEKRRGVHAYLNKIFSDYGTCIETLKGHDLSGSSSDTERSFEIESVKDPSGAELLNFAKNSEGGLTHEETKKRLKNFGIDRFNSMTFIYRPAESSLGRIVLKTESKIEGFYEKKNPEIVWELSGIKVEAVSGAGDQVTRCSDSHFLRNKCGVGVDGAPHENGGGFVEDTASVASSAYVGKDAVVCGIAQVKDTSRVYQNAQVKGKAVVQNGSHIYGNALVSGGTIDNGRVSGSATIKGDAQVKGGAQVYGDNAQVYGNAEIKDGARVFNNAKVHGNAIVIGANVEIYNDAEVFENAKINYTSVIPTLYIKIYRNAKVYGDSRIGPRVGSSNSGNVDIYGDAKVFGSAQVTGGKIYERAEISGGQTFSASKMFDDAVMTGGNNSGILQDRARMSGGTNFGTVKDGARVENASLIMGEISENAVASGGSAILYSNVGGDVNTNGKRLTFCDCDRSKPAGSAEGTTMRMTSDCEGESKNRKSCSAAATPPHIPF